MPELLDDDGNPVQFRRTLLNKCQDEFDHGVMAMKAVLDREQREKEEGPKVSTRDASLVVVHRWWSMSFPLIVIFLLCTAGGGP